MPCKHYNINYQKLKRQQTVKQWKNSDDNNEITVLSCKNINYFWH